MNHKEIVFNLMEIGAIRFGDFTLKSGIISPIYIDLRLIISYPSLLTAIAEAFWNKIKFLKFDLICGVPYTAIPLATAISLYYNVPMIMRRKEAKEYGTKKNIEGAFHKGQRCLIIEDLITSGTSLLETTASLETEGLIVQEAAVLIDREQGGRKKLNERGYGLCANFTLSALIEILEEARKLEPCKALSIKKFIESNQVS